MSETRRPEHADPGDPEAEYRDRHERLQGQYRFYILNPASTEGVNYSLWVLDGDHEYPVMQSNTGGFVTFNSKDRSIGNGLQPTAEFLELVGVGFHEAMCFTPRLYFEGDHFERTVDMVYDGAERDYEVWAAAHLIREFALGSMLAPELEPLAEWAGWQTEFGVPVLADGDQCGDHGE